MRRLALVVGMLVIAGCGGDGAEPVTVELRSLSSFQPVGTVTLEEGHHGTRVEISAPDLANASSPAIRGGLCVELRPREHKLNEFEDGRSVTELDVPLDELLARQSKVTVSRGEVTPHRIAACTELPYEGQEPELVVVDLVEGGTDKGLGWLEPDENGRTRVGILVFDVIPGPQPAAITRGGCQGEPVHELTEIRDSESVTEVEASLDTLAGGGHWLVAGSTCGPIRSG